MLRSVYLAGIVLLVVGFLLLGLGLIPEGASTTRTIPSNAPLSLGTTTLTPQTLSVSWANETVETRIYLIVGTPACTSPSGLVARGTGANGTISATLRPGTTYELYGCGVSTYKNVTVNYTLRGGIGYPVILGGVAVGIGIVLVLLGARKRSHEIVLEGGAGARRPWEVDPVATAAALRQSLKGSRRDFIPPATPANQLRGLAVQTCPTCGRAYSTRTYRACPQCSTPYPPSSERSR